MYFSHPTNYAYLIGGVFAIVVSILIISKDRKAILNILLGSSLLFWGISLTTNALTFLFKNPDLFAAEFVRDIATSTGSIASFLSFAAAFSLYKGEHYLRKPYFIVPWSLAMIINSVIASVFDVLEEDTDLPGIKTTQAIWVMIFLYGIPLILLIVSNIFFGLARREVDNKQIRTRILLFIFGYEFIIFGVLIFAFYGIFEQSLNVSYPVLENIIWIIASLFWTIGPLFMVIGFYLGKANIIGRRQPELERID